MKTLFHRAKSISSADSIHQEITHLKHIFQANGYNRRSIEKALSPTTKKPKPNNTDRNHKHNNKVFLPYIKGVTDRIAKLLTKRNISTVFLPTAKIANLLNNPKDILPPTDYPGIYKIPCHCGKVYIGMTSRSVRARTKEHERHLRLSQPDKSAVAEHAIAEKHNIDFQKTSVLIKNPDPSHLPFLEAIEILKHPLNFNRDSGTQLNPIWSPLLKITN
ncbi:predicted protein [Pediculus humanus corporis]|uniref:Predicted protein n=1 Tax=Pediculus humanus subsp. corporis TaxID=121224 RepID=E0W064_PEDHC|nr:uncharacterized protein Phum_PHUM546110 [Pediculus humanus corporis]EEB19020.1 predicted protein [Pediculus humanus corporis]